MTARKSETQIDILAGKDFTQGRVGGKLRAVKWGPGVTGEWYLAVAGAAPQSFPDEQAVTAAMLSALGMEPNPSSLRIDADLSGAES